MSEHREIEVTVARKDVVEGGNPYDLIEDQLVPWRLELWEDGWNVKAMDVQVLEDKGFNSDNIYLLITAHLEPAPKEN